MSQPLARSRLGGQTRSTSRLVKTALALARPRRVQLLRRIPRPRSCPTPTSAGSRQLRRNASRQTPSAIEPACSKRLSASGMGGAVDVVAKRMRTLKRRLPATRAVITLAVTSLSALGKAAVAILASKLSGQLIPTTKLRRVTTRAGYVASRTARSPTFLL